MVPDTHADDITRTVDEKGRVHFSNQPREKIENRKTTEQRPNAHAWSDEHGKKIYSDRPSETVRTARRRIQRNIECLDGVTEIFSGPAATNSGRVLFLTARWCKVSERARAYLKKNRIKFIEYDIDRHRKGRIIYEKLPRRGLPVIVTDNHKMFGFRADLATRVLQSSSRYSPPKK